MNHSKKMLFFVIFILFFILGSLLAIVSFKSEYILKNDLVVEYMDDNLIEINNSLPVNDTLGKSFQGDETKKGIQGYLELSIHNNSSRKQKYEIYLTKVNSEKKLIRDEYIKFYLTDENNNPYTGFDKNHIPVFKDFLYLNDKPDSKLLYRGVIAGKSFEVMKLHVWLSDSYVINSEEEIFNVLVGVREK